MQSKRKKKWKILFFPRMVITSDLSPLFNELIEGGILLKYPLAAVDAKRSYFHDFRIKIKEKKNSKKTKKIIFSESISHFNLNATKFNGGFWVMNLTKYKIDGIKDEMYGWLSKHSSENPIWSWGTQGLLLAIFYDKWPFFAFSFFLISHMQKGKA